MEFRWREGRCNQRWWCENPPRGLWTRLWTCCAHRPRFSPANSSSDLHQRTTIQSFISFPFNRFLSMILPLTATASSELDVPSTVISNWATSPAAISSILRSETDTRLVSAILHVNGQSVVHQFISDTIRIRVGSFVSICASSLLNAIDGVNRNRNKGGPGTVSPLNLISMVWILACSGVKLTRHLPPPKTWTWLGTSPSLMEISSWPSPAWLASTKSKN